MRDQNWSIFATDDKFDAEQGLVLLTDNLQKAIDSLAPDKKLNIKKKSLYSWIDTKLKLLISKRDAIRRCYERTGSRQLLNEYLALAKSTEEKSETARCAYMHNHIGNAYKNYKRHQ